MKLLLLSLLLFSFNAYSKEFKVHGFTNEQIAEMAKHNQQMAKQENFSSSVAPSLVMPFYEYGNTGYLVFSDDDFYGIATEMKKAIAQNLPEGVTLIVYTQSENINYQKEIFKTYSKYLSKDRLVVVQVPQGGQSDFWSRDNTPIPVLNDGQNALVDAKYYYYFEPDQFLSQLFGANLTSHQFFYEGGNFMANAKGDCIVVNRRQTYSGGTSDTAAIPDDLFQNLYGCKTLTRLKHLKGIGHADEVVKFMSDETVMTDTEDYAKILRDKGFKVIMLPEAGEEFETYANSLQVNNVLYVPIFGESTDQKAIEAYKSVNPNLKIVPINTHELATQGQGGIHCITMNYPPGPLNKVLENLKAKKVF